MKTGTSSFFLLPSSFTVLSQSSATYFQPSDVVPFGSAEPRGQFGAEGLQNFVLTLDSLNHRLRFERGEKK